MLLSIGSYFSGGKVETFKILRGFQFFRPANVFVVVKVVSGDFQKPATQKNESDANLFFSHVVLA